MAAAYAAVVSLMHQMELIQLYHARHPIFLDQQQRQLQSLNAKVSFLLHFLESYSHDGAQGLVSQIADAAYAAEDIIESHILDGIYARFQKSKNGFFASKDHKKNISDSCVLQTLIKDLEFMGRDVSSFQVLLESYSYGDSTEADDLESQISDDACARKATLESPVEVDVHALSLEKGKGLAQRENSNHFSEELQQIIEDMDFLEKEVMKVELKSKHEDVKPKDLAPTGSLRPPPTGKNTLRVSDDVFNKVMDMVTGQRSTFQIIPITGMGGIGKTTLAKHVYDNSEQYFDIRGWLTISQEYDVREMLLDLVQQIGVPLDQKELKSLQYYPVGEKLYKHLSGRRYLIVMDDIWSIEAWDMLKLYLPDNNNGSRIMITTRLLYLANNLGSFELYKMNLLEENESWSLLCGEVFPLENCPTELIEAGKRIAKYCRGLPLSIVVIAKLLAKSKMTREYWEYIAEDIYTSINSQDDEICLKILSLSYRNLPIHLKPCFLYIGVFPEDLDIRASKLIKLWVAEGFIKPSKERSFEEVGEDYLKDLINRNLIFVTKFGSTGKIKTCKIHDILRDLCLREANKEKLLYVTKVRDRDILQNIITRRRVAFHTCMSHEKSALQPSQAARTTSFLRSLIGDLQFDSTPSLRFTYLWVLPVLNDNSPVGTSHLFNSRYLHFGAHSSTHFPSSIHLFWGLQTLIITNHSPVGVAPPEIWELTQLRHLMINGLCLPDPPSAKVGGKDDVVLENLQTLLYIRDLKYTEEVLKRIPNLKKLKLKYCRMTDDGLSYYCLNNLCRLLNLHSLECQFVLDNRWLKRTDFLQNLEFPLSLKKLALFYCNLEWKDTITKIGMLPHLEKLKLECCRMGEEWNTTEGQFLCLKVLQIFRSDFVYWTTESTHFPRLEHLFLHEVRRLKEIPSEIGDIVTLQSIHLKNCHGSLIASAKDIQEEQQSLGNEDFRVVVEGN